MQWVSSLKGLASLIKKIDEDIEVGKMSSNHNCVVRSAFMQLQGDDDGDGDVSP